MNAAPPVTWIESTSWELDFFGLPRRIPWPAEVDPAEANKNPFEVDHLMRAIELLGDEAGPPWPAFAEAAVHFGELTEALEEGDGVRARELLEQVEQTHAGTAFVAFHQACVARLEGRNDDAIALFGQAAEKTPGLAPIWLNLGTTLALEGRRDEAVRAFARALEITPNEPAALEGLVQLRALVKLLRDPNDPASAAYVDLPTFRKMAASQIPLLAQQQPGQLLAFGEQLLREGLVPDIAVQALEKRRELYPDDAPALLTLAAAYRAAHQLDEARERLVRYTELNPADAAGYFRLAQIAHEKEEAGAERAALEKVLELDPNHQQAIGIYFQVQPGEHDPGREQALVAVGEGRNSWMAFLMASNIARLRGDKERSVQLAERALEIAPESEEVILNYTVAVGEARELAKLASVVKPRVESGRFSKRLDWNYAQVLNGLGLRQDAINVLRRAQAAPEAPEDFKASVSLALEAWSGVLTGCGTRLEVHESGFLIRPILLTLGDSDGGIVIKAGSPLPAEGTFTWRADRAEAQVTLQQGQTGSAREPQDLGVFRIRGVQAAGSGPTIVECHLTALPDGALHFRARQGDRRLLVGWAAREHS
ncbi:MAG: tetratricopeptide repeat protein [Verrucomicrobiota bacterium]|nr:tetratricopeptide repeat protein [Verrucomicrobiota bacterium]